VRKLYARNRDPGSGIRDWVRILSLMKITCLSALSVLLVAAAAAVAAQTAPAEPKSYGIDPWHLNVPNPVANPVTSVTERIPGSDLSAEIIYVEMNDGTYA
jgi:hypothetical protein